MSWLAVGALVVTAVGTGVSVYSSVQSGKAQQQVAERNSEIATKAARNEEQTAAENVARIRKQQKRKISNIRARQAGSGVNIGMGSSLDVIGTAAADFELEALDLFREGSNRARTYDNEAAVGLWSGEQASSAANMQAAGSLLSGAGSTADNYVQYKQSGVFKVKGAT